MKKALLLILSLAFFVGCSPDSDISTEFESIDLTKIIDPDTVTAEAEFDHNNNGIYKGVFVSNDISYHGVLTVNLANDSRYNAILEYGNNKSRRMGFVRVNNNSETTDSNLIEFRGTNAGFILNVTDYSQPVVTEAYVDGQTAQVKLLKETSVNRVLVTLGTFFDDADPVGFNGAWDLLSSSTRDLIIPTYLPPPAPANYLIRVNNIDGFVLTKSGGAQYTDNIMEDFDPGANCAFLLPSLPLGPAVAPYYSGAQTVVVLPVPLVTRDVDEFSAIEQTSNFLSEDCTWSLLYSKIVNRYYDEDCNEIAAGTWSWKGRTGSILID